MLCLLIQALPHVGLLIVMLFFIYAVIGMQVRKCPVVPLVLVIVVFPIFLLSFSTSFYRCLVKLPWLMVQKSTATTTSKPSLKLFCYCSGEGKHQCFMCSLIQVTLYNHFCNCLPVVATLFLVELSVNWPLFVCTGLPLESSGLKSCWPQCTGSSVTLNQTMAPERSIPAAPASPSATFSAFTCCVHFW